MRAREPGDQEALLGEIAALVELGRTTEARELSAQLERAEAPVNEAARRLHVEGKELKKQLKAFDAADVKGKQKIAKALQSYAGDRFFVLACSKDATASYLAGAVRRGETFSLYCNSWRH